MAVPTYAGAVAALVQSELRRAGCHAKFATRDYILAQSTLPKIFLTPQSAGESVNDTISLKQAEANGRAAAYSCDSHFGEVEVIPVNVRDPHEIERAVTAFARSSNGGLIVMGSGLATVHRNLIVTLAARHKLPAV